MTVQTPNLTTRPKGLVTFLQDRSGSMLSVQDSTIESFNGYLNGLQNEKEAEILFSYLQFDSESLDAIHTAVPVKDAKMLTRDTFVPRGSTPLVESCIRTIEAIDTALAKRTDNPRVTVCFQTDGQENASAAGYTWDRLRTLVEARQERGWNFNFMGAGLASYAYVQAARMGVSGQSTMSYDHQNVGSSKHAYAASAANTASFSAGRRANTAYTVQQKAASGDTSTVGVSTPDLTPAPDPVISTTQAPTSPAQGGN